MGSGTLKDTSLEQAQKEIQRRLLRGHKLKRIEREEMRRLAAMGWKPPVEGASASGPSVHDAASVDTTDMPMQVKTAGFIDGMETEDLSIDIAGQVVHMEGVIRRAKFPVDDDHGHVHTLKLHAENKSGYDVEVGLEVNGVRQVPLRLPVEGPLVP